MWRLRLVQSIALLLTTAALLAGCGDTPSPQATDAGQEGQVQQADQEYDLVETGRAAAALLGGDGAAAYALLKASDNGYSPYQIAHAVDARLIDDSGVIQGITPAWPRADTLSRGNGASTTRFAVASVAAGASPAVVFAEAEGGFVGRGDLEQMFAEISDPEQAGRWLVWLFGTTGTGYSVGQVTDYLVTNQPLTDLAPPTGVGVPVIVDGDGDVVTPELPTDWPYKGRNVLKDLQRDEDLDFNETLTVLVIGMVNGGYSSAQIHEALLTNSIGLASTQGGSSSADGALSPCYIRGGEIVPPAETTPWSPAEILIEDVLQVWPVKNTASLDSVGKLRSGEKVSLKLTPFIPSPDSDVAITSHDVVMEIELADNGAYDITGRWRIDLVQETADEDLEQGATIVLEGEFYSKEPTALSQLKLATEYSVIAHTLAGDVAYAWKDTATEGFLGELDEDLDGNGVLVNIGVGLMNWDTYPVDE